MGCKTSAARDSGMLNENTLFNDVSAEGVGVEDEGAREKEIICFLKIESHKCSLTDPSICLMALYNLLA